jgi:oligopeptide transport system ATP-binding protein
MIPIEGTPVDLLDPPKGCSFGPRCAHCMKICLRNDPPLVQIGENGHVSACWLHVRQAAEQKEAK